MKSKSESESIGCRIRTGIWCLKIMPSYKGSAAYCETLFFKSKKEAEEALKEKEKEYLLRYNDFSKEINGVTYYFSNENKFNTDEINELKEYAFTREDLYNKRFSEYLYEDALVSMDMEVFTPKIFKVKIS